jgi:single-stranded DNA-binding protein
MSGIECAFLGTIARAESKTSKAGKQYVRLSVRVGDGDALQWVSCMVFDPELIVAADALKGRAAYFEGTLRLDKWTGQDGVEKQGLSCMARLTRLPQIGGNKPTKRDDGAAAAAPQRAMRARDDDLSDSIPF